MEPRTIVGTSRNWRGRNWRGVPASFSIPGPRFAYLVPGVLLPRLKPKDCTSATGVPPNPILHLTKPKKAVTQYTHMYVCMYVCDGLSKCLFPVLLIHRNSMRAASCLPLKTWPTLMTWKRGNSSLPLEIFLKPQESANARRFSFAVAGTVSWTVCLCVCASLNAICFLTCLLINAVSLL